ncbi:unnamed protein product, partial [marine sediment metagenome]
AQNCYNKLNDKTWRRNVYKENPVYKVGMANHSTHKLKCLKRDRFVCQSCKKRFKQELLTAHHILSRENGGMGDLDNLITLCKKCHDDIEPLNLKKKQIINYNKYYKPPKPKIVGTNDWHTWVYGGCANPYLERKIK